MNKDKLVNLFLVLFSVSIVLFIAEFTLRSLIFSEPGNFTFLKKPSDYAIYVKDENEDFFNDDYWKLTYLFSRPTNLERVHPVLGWVASSFDLNTLDHRNIAECKGKTPVLLFGDSFAHCLDTVDCFESIMNSDSAFSQEHHLLNYGVGGYGVDQIYLLLKECLPKYEHPLVILSVLTTDLDRSLLSVRDAQKPYFELVDGILELKGTPIKISSDQFFESNPPEIRSYLWNRVINSKMNLFSQADDLHKSYVEEIEKLNSAILKKAFDEINSTGAKSIVLIFKPTWQKDDWRLDFLKNTCETNGMPYIVNDDLIKADMEKTARDPWKYYISNDGHPSSISNKLVSKKLIEWVMSPNFINNPLSANNYGKEKS